MDYKDKKEMRERIAVKDARDDHRQVQITVSWAINCATSRATMTGEWGSLEDYAVEYLNLHRQLVDELEKEKSVSDRQAKERSIEQKDRGKEEAEYDTNEI